MPVRAALLRGVNVGGSGRLPMGEWRALLSAAGLERPQTHIQSGNAVFGSDLPDAQLGAQIADAIQTRFGFRPMVFLLDAAALATARHHRFGAVPDEKVHAIFIAGSAPPDMAAIDALAAPSETWDWQPGLLRLYAPDGIGRSRLAGRLPGLVGAPSTARNLRTVAGVAELMRLWAEPAR